MSTECQQKTLESLLPVKHHRDGIWNISQAKIICRENILTLLINNTSRYPSSKRMIRNEICMIYSNTRIP